MNELANVHTVNPTVLSVPGTYDVCGSKVFLILTGDMFLFIFKERKGEKEKYRSEWLLFVAPLGIEPATFWCTDDVPTN